MAEDLLRRKPLGRCLEIVVGDVAEPRRPIRPDGGLLTIADLPAPGTKRWVIRRKAIVVAAIRGGLLTLEEARSRYALTVEELLDGNIRLIATASPVCGSLAFRNIREEDALRVRARPQDSLPCAEVYSSAQSSTR
jgi:hypothetical protein